MCKIRSMSQAVASKEIDKINLTPDSFYAFILDNFGENFENFEYSEFEKEREILTNNSVVEVAYEIQCFSAFWAKPVNFILYYNKILLHAYIIAAGISSDQNKEFLPIIMNARRQDKNVRSEIIKYRARTPEIDLMFENLTKN